jgi:hypothetical protein
VIGLAASHTGAIFWYGRISRKATAGRPMLVEK